MTRPFAASPAGRVPPHDLDAEAAVLSAVMLDAAALDEVVDILRPEHFYSDANGLIWTAAAALHANHTPVDIVSLASELRSRERLAECGGPSYLGQISDATPATAHVAAHARTVVEKWRVRSLIAACQRIVAEGYGDTGPTGEWLQGAEAAVAAVVQDATTDDSTATMRDVIVGVFEALKSDTPEVGVRSGIHTLDAIMGVMRPCQLIIVAAGTSVGKSALALNMSVNVYAPKPAAADTPPPTVLIFSAEMSREELAQRALFSIAQVDASKLVHKDRLTKADWGYLAGAAAYVAKDNCLIDDRVDLSPLQIRAKCRRVAAQCAKAGGRLALVVVDYIQLLNGRAGLPRDTTREAEVSGIGRALKNIAKECAVPIVALSQLNDDAAKRQPRKRKGEDVEVPRPRMSDLRESKALAMHADKVILIHNPHAGERALSGDAPPESEEVELIVDKNRGGRKGMAKCEFFPAYTLFTNLEGGK